MRLRLGIVFVVLIVAGVWILTRTVPQDGGCDPRDDSCAIGCP